MNYSLYEKGLLESSEWTLVIDQDVTFLFGSDYGRAYWKQVSTGTALPAELVSYVDAKLAKSPEANPARFYESIQNALAKEKEQ